MKENLSIFLSIKYHTKIANNFNILIMLNKQFLNKQICRLNVTSRFISLNPVHQGQKYQKTSFDYCACLIQIDTHLEMRLLKNSWKKESLKGHFAHHFTRHINISRQNHQLAKYVCHVKYGPAYVYIGPSGQKTRRNSLIFLLPFFNVRDV